MSGPLARLGRILTVACGLLCLAVSPAAAEPESERARVIRGALLYSFAKFVEWPEGALDDRLTYCVLGDRAMGELMERKVKGLSVQGRPVEVRRLGALERLDRCEVLYVGPRVEARRATAALGKAPVLTVGGAPGFLESGGMIRLLEHEDRIVFEVNLDASRRAGLRLNARLLRAASRVEEGP